MAKILDMPKLSPTMEEGQLAAWHKNEGDAIDIDDLLADVETDKATMEFRSFDRGTLLKILVEPGSVVKLGQAVAVLGNPGEDISSLVAQASANSAASGPAAAPAAASTAAPGPNPVEKVAAITAPAAATVAAVPNGDASGGRVKASPYVRKLAREQGVDLQGIHGSGPHGRIVARDVGSSSATTAPSHAGTEAVVATPGAPALRAPQVQPLSMMRKTIARRLTESKTTVPHFYLSVDVNAEPLVQLRERINQELAASVEKTENPPKISVNDLLIKACALALANVPECNAQYTPDALLLHTRIDISVAVAVPEGLVTPVLRDADKKSVLAISREVRALAGRAKEKKLEPHEMTNGTFSISNLGMFGIDSFSAVINPPEGAILAIGQVRSEPVVDNHIVVPGKRVTLTLSCDHRVIDGAVGARFLAELRRLIEHPMYVAVG